MQKRGMPRAAMSDNGAAMTATEMYPSGDYRLWFLLLTP
jgi:hypothetical protein